MSVNKAALCGSQSSLTTYWQCASYKYRFFKYVAFKYLYLLTELKNNVAEFDKKNCVLRIK